MYKELFVMMTTTGGQNLFTMGTTITEALKTLPIFAGGEEET